MIHSKKIIVYVIIAITIIVIVGGTYTTMFRSPSNNKPTMQSTVQPVANSNASSIGQFKNQFCGLTSIPNSNNYITEFKLPHTCEMPLGIAVDSLAGKVWYVSTKQGTLGSYNLITKKFER